MIFACLLLWLFIPPPFWPWLLRRNSLPSPKAIYQVQNLNFDCAIMKLSKMSHNGRDARSSLFLNKKVMTWKNIYSDSCLYRQLVIIEVQDIELHACIRDSFLVEFAQVRLCCWKLWLFPLQCWRELAASMLIDQFHQLSFFIKGKFFQLEKNSSTSLERDFNFLFPLFLLPCVDPFYWLYPSLRFFHWFKGPKVI